MYQNYRYFCINIGQKLFRMHRKIRMILISMVLLFPLQGSAQDLEDLWRRRIMETGPLSGTPDTLSVVIIGDVMMHARQLSYDDTPFLERLSGRFRAADIAVANMEFSLGGPPYTGYPAFSTPDSYADYVAGLGVNVFLTANNHILDRGREGLRRTLEKYHVMEGIRVAGSAVSAQADSSAYPLLLAEKGFRIALINFTYGTNAATPSGWPSVHLEDRDEIARAFERARRLGADFIVVLPHWGLEYELRHSARQESLARWLAEQGADVIVGSHPHVVQDSVRIGRTPVFYSIGNAISNMSAPNTRLGLMVSLRFVRDRMRQTRMLPPQLEFLWCTLPGMLTDNYATIPVRDYVGKRDSWLNPHDYDNMIATWRRVKAATGIEDEAADGADCANNGI